MGAIEAGTYFELHIVLAHLNQLLTDPVAVYAARGGIALLFALAGWSKLRNLSVFRATIADYELVPGVLLAPAAILIVIAEFSIAIGAWIPIVAPTVMSVAMVLLLLYASAIAINLIRGRKDIDCGCTGPAVRQSLSSWLLLRNTVLASIASLGVNIPVARETSTLDFVLAAVVIAAGTAIYAAANQLMANAPRLDALDGLMEAN